VLSLGSAPWSDISQRPVHSGRKLPAEHGYRVNGWVHGRVGYATNEPPFDSDVWFHLADGAGWVSFAGVRMNPTTFDPTGTADGGPPAATSPSCEGAIQ